MVVTFANNTVGLYMLNIHVKNAEASCLRSITNCGHHSEVRSLSFSSDNLAIVSGSAEAVKLWNRQTFTCLRTVQTGLVVKILLLTYKLQLFCYF